MKKDIIIISGLAKGIDSKAHQTCINSGGKTIAVIGSGFNNIYPKENEKMYKRIIETGGTIVSEYAPDTPVDSRNFPKRNRIVSGLSEGVVMIEGKYRSGTTITAQYALNQNKKVFCLPHSISNSYWIGPNSIIQKGGILITKADDIIKEFQKDGIKFKDFHWLTYRECALNFKRKYPNSGGTCIGERDVTAKPPYIELYSTYAHTKILFHKKGIFDNKNMTYFHDLQRLINQFGYTTRDLS